MDRIILASASPRRKQLMEWAEIPFEFSSEADELIPEGMAIPEIPVFLASQKSSLGQKEIGNGKNCSGGRHYCCFGSAGVGQTG